MRRRGALMAVLTLAASTAGCRNAGQESAHVNLTSLDQLRSAFNADSGKVRAIFLASPT